MTELSVPINRLELLETLKRNKESHREIYNEAMAGYRASLKAVLTDALQELEDGNTPSIIRFSLRQPETHVREYNTAISMLEVSEDDTVILTRTQFSQYVEEQWDWKDYWATSNSEYSATAKRMSEVVNG